MENVSPQKVDLSKLTEPAVQSAIDEFQRLGRETFLRRYGYKKSLEYLIEEDGEYYDSKAIAGVAYSYLIAGCGDAIQAKDFSGGDRTVVQALDKLNIKVVQRSQIEAPIKIRVSPVVLTQNEEYAGEDFGWLDETGIRYHFPNGYKGLVVQGAPFVYYRGVRRKGGAKGPAEYFGHGVVGEVYLDLATEDLPKGKQRWFAEIEDYEAFDKPVPIEINGAHLEIAERKNHWRDGVRGIDYSIFGRVMKHADATKKHGKKHALKVQTPIQGIDLLAVTKTGGGKGGASFGGNKSTEAKLVGDTGEKLAAEWIKNSFKHVEYVKDVAKKCLGWDLEYKVAGKPKKRLEVKSKVAPQFRSFDLTANERQKCLEHRSSYQILLIANVMSAKPIVQLIENPAELFDSGEWQVEVTGWRVRRVSQEH